MNICLLASVFDPLLNWLRSLSQFTRGVILLVALILSFLCLAKSFNMGKNSATRPIKWVMLGLCLLFMGVAVLIGLV